jgi:hypothetical protein
MNIYLSDFPGLGRNVNSLYIALYCIFQTALITRGSVPPVFQLQCTCVVNSAKRLIFDLAHSPFRIDSSASFLF